MNEEPLTKKRGPKRFRELRDAKKETTALEAAAAQLLTRESREIAAIPYDEPAPASRSGRIALHNGRFLRATLESTERHNRRLAGEPRCVTRRRREEGVESKRNDDDAASGAVEIVLGDDRDAGILFEKEAATGRPVVRGLTASARPDVARLVVPGMLLSKIAGVKCKNINYKASLDLIRALEKPLKLCFKRPSKHKKSTDNDGDLKPTKKKRRRDDNKRNDESKQRRRHS